MLQKHNNIVTSLLPFHRFSGFYQFNWLFVSVQIGVLYFTILVQIECFKNMYKCFVKLIF